MSQLCESPSHGMQVVYATRQSTPTTILSYLSCLFMATVTWSLCEACPNEIKPRNRRILDDESSATYGWRCQLLLKRHVPSWRRLFVLGMANIFFWVSRHSFCPLFHCAPPQYTCICIHSSKACTRAVLYSKTSEERTLWGKGSSPL